MGMDVYGKNATAKEGQYFRNNVWWWHPLAAYIEMRYADEIPRIKKVDWHSNSGDGLGPNDSYRLSKLLEADLTSGRVKLYADGYESQRRAQTEPCRTCADSLLHGVPAPGWRILDEQSGIKEKCPQCDGTAQMPTNPYPFSVENVHEFMLFLRSCGGFEIC